jgi:4-hydroxybenzoate polyprenyltransferase
MAKPIDLIRLARPRHWVKNVIVLLPVVFARRADDARSWLLAAAAAGAFCLVSSAVYVLNDLCDRASDRHHPRKKDRPIAAGRVGARPAVIAAGLLVLGGAALTLPGGLPLAAMVGAYLALQIGYSLGLKHVMLLDVICVALGFVLRAAGGAVAIDVVVSGWLVVCTFTICLFMGFCKRYSEIATLVDPDIARSHRPVLDGYSPELLTHLITLSAGLAIISFLLYASSPRTVQEFDTTGLVYTLPLVVYGVCRFAMLSMRGTYTDPTELILRDRPFQLTVLLWAIASALLVLYGSQVPGSLKLEF